MLKNISEGNISNVKKSLFTFYNSEENDRVFFFFCI